MAVRPSITSSHFALAIAGKHAGYLNRFEGGNAYAEVVTSNVASDVFSKKHLGNPTYGNITASFGVSSSGALLACMQDLLAGRSVAKNGSIYTLDNAGSAIEEMQFSDARIAAIAFPASDGASKESAYLTLTIKPESVRIKRGKTSKRFPPAVKQKAWSPENFRFVLGGLPTKRVSKIDAFVIQQEIAAGSVGDTRDGEWVPGKVNIPNLRVSVAAADTDPWLTWFEDFVIDGNNGDNKELEGTITWLSPDLKTELMTLTLSHVGIFRLAPAAPAPSFASARTIVADLYCEQMELKVKK